MPKKKLDIIDHIMLTYTREVAEVSCGLFWRGKVNDGRYLEDYANFDISLIIGTCALFLSYDLYIILWLSLGPMLPGYGRFDCTVIYVSISRILTAYMQLRPGNALERFSAQIYITINTFSSHAVYTVSVILLFLGL